MSRSRLVFVLACFLGVPAGAAFAQNVSFHRFVDELYPTGPPTEQKIKLGREFRNVLDSLAPTRSPLKGVTVDADNTVLLGEVFEGFEMSRDAVGVVIAMDSRIGRLHYVFPKSTVDALAGLADERARALPHQYPAVSGQIVQRVSVAVAEARALPQEFTSRLVVVPADARLHFSVGFDDLLAGLPPRVPTRIKARQSDGSIAETILHDGRPTAPVRFRIVVEIADSITTVFDEEHRPAPNAINEHWRERTVDLSGFAGKRARFRFIREEVSVSNTSQGAYSFPLWGSPILTGRKIPADERKPNVILISLDTLRADHLGCYGYARATSPNIDAFAKDANLFERCLSNSSWTTPAHA